MGCDIRSIFKQCAAGLNSEFSFLLIIDLIKAKEPSLHHYLTIAKERTNGFMSFLKVVAQNEMSTTLPWLVG